jgi:hypothetical protein
MPLQTSTSQIVLNVRTVSMDARATDDVMNASRWGGFRRLGLGLCLRQLDIWRLTTKNCTMKNPMPGKQNARGSRKSAAAALTRGNVDTWAQMARTHSHKNDNAMKNLKPLLPTPLPTLNLLATTKQGP